MQQPHPQPRGPRLRRIERVQHQVAPFQQQKRRNHGGDGAGGPQILRAHPEHVAEQDMVQVHVRTDPGVDHDPQPEHARKHHPHDGVLLDAAVLGQIAGGERGHHPGTERAEDQRQPEDIGQDHARQDRMADCIAHQRPAFQHQETGQQRRRHRHDGRDQKGIPHEGELERQKDLFDHGRAPSPPDACRARARAASSPCLGARTKTARKISVCRQTMIPPVAPFRK